MAHDIPLAFVKKQQEYNSHNFSKRNIFLTGATGVLGGYLLKTLLLSTDSKIYCLVRAKDTQHAFNRLKSILFVYEKKETIDKKILDVVFLPRKKVGIYHKLDQESIKLLEEVFIKVKP